MMILQEEEGSITAYCVTGSMRIRCIRNTCARASM
jgi:hypothetical protein